MTVIRDFSGDYRFLSNFYPSPIHWGWGPPVEYATAEHLYQALKTDDEQWRRRIAEATTPTEAKRRGQQVPMVPYWEQRKFSVMGDVVRQKFCQNPQLTRQLIDTGNALLVEGNTWHDQTWGDCSCGKHADQCGRNALGIILMRERLHWQAIGVEVDLKHG